MVFTSGDGYAGLTIDANTVSVKLTGIESYYSGGVIAVTGNTLESTDTSSQYWNKGSGIDFTLPSSQRWGR